MSTSEIKTTARFPYEVRIEEMDGRVTTDKIFHTFVLTVWR